MIFRGEIYWVDLGRLIGHEPGKTRPGVVVSANLLSNGPGRIVGIVPTTSSDFGLRSHVALDSEETGLLQPSFARCDQLRMLSIERLSGRLGFVPIDRMNTIDDCLRFVLNL